MTLFSNLDIPYILLNAIIKVCLCGAKEKLDFSTNTTDTHISQTAIF